MAKTKDQEKLQDGAANAGAVRTKICGVVMPISDHPEYETGHWAEVRDILFDGIKKAGFEPNMVSDDEAVGLIQESIVTNLYDNEIVVCDVSSKNPNVMFELGLRLAFDKPTIIVKDDITDYTFDIGVIKHLDYPATLRHPRIEIFKAGLAKIIEATHKKANETERYSPFLKTFGRHIVPAEIETTEISEQKFLLEELKKIVNDNRNQRPNVRVSPGSFRTSPQLDKEIEAEIWKYLKQYADNSPAIIPAETVDRITVKVTTLFHDRGYPVSRNAVKNLVVLLAKNEGLEILDL